MSLVHERSHRYTGGRTAMRYLLLALLSTATIHASIILQATCSAPTAIYPYDFGDYPAGTPVPGTAGAQTSALNAFGSASATCASSFPDGGFPIAADANVDAGSA